MGVHGAAATLRVQGVCQDRSAQKLTWGGVDEGCDWLNQLM